MFHSSRVAWAVAGLFAAMLMPAACTNPATPTPPKVEPPPPNTPPVIRSLSSSRMTLEVNESTQVSAIVEDQESSVANLVFLWSSPSGSFVGQGAQVEWRPPLDEPTPATLVLTLTVVETYPALGSLGKIVTLEHRVSSSVSVRVHNSSKEVGDMGLAFLEKFADSTVSPQAALVDFSTSCRGRQAEFEDIERNRDMFVILGRQLGEPRVTSLTKYIRADVRIACDFVSRRTKCPAGEAGCVVGAIENANGDCRLTAVYEQARWWLCDSRFDPDEFLPPSMRLFFGSGVLD